MWEGCAGACLWSLCRSGTTSSSCVTGRAAKLGADQPAGFWNPVYSSLPLLIMPAPASKA